MFGLTKKVDYGLLFLAALAERQGRVTPLAEIATQKRLPLSFLSQVAVRLKNAGIIDSKEGKGGGYFLKNNPAKISIIEVVECLEGPVGLIGCSLGERCPSEGFCSVREPFLSLEQDLKDFIGSYTVADLVSGGV